MVLCSLVFMVGLPYCVCCIVVLGICWFVTRLLIWLFDCCDLAALVLVSILSIGYCVGCRVGVYCSCCLLGFMIAGWLRLLIGVGWFGYFLLLVVYC